MRSTANHNHFPEGYKEMRDRMIDHYADLCLESWEVIPGYDCIDIRAINYRLYIQAKQDGMGNFVSWEIVTSFEDSHSKGKAATVDQLRRLLYVQLDDLFAEYMKINSQQPARATATNEENEMNHNLDNYQLSALFNGFHDLRADLLSFEEDYGWLFDRCEQCRDYCYACPACKPTAIKAGGELLALFRSLFADLQDRDLLDESNSPTIDRHMLAVASEQESNSPPARAQSPLESARADRYGVSRSTARPPAYIVNHARDLLIESLSDRSIRRVADLAYMVSGHIVDLLPALYADCEHSVTICHEIISAYNSQWVIDDLEDWA